MVPARPEEPIDASAAYGVLRNERMAAAFRQARGPSQACAAIRSNCIQFRNEFA